LEYHIATSSRLSTDKVFPTENYSIQILVLTGSDTLIIHVPILQRKLDWDDVPTFDSQRSLAMTKLVDDIVDFSFNLDYV